MSLSCLAFFKPVQFSVYMGSLEHHHGDSDRQILQSFHLTLDTVTHLSNISFLLALI